jgi:hypothetical protein
MRFCAPLSIAVAGAVIVSCEHPERGPTEADAHVVQIVGVRAGPTSIECRGGPVREIDFNVQIVNTTAEAVRVTSVSSVGIVIRSSVESMVGQQVYLDPNLPIKPDSAVLRAGDGDVTYTFILKTACASSGGPQSPNSVDVNVTLFVRTTVGEFATVPVTIHQAYN